MLWSAPQPGFRARFDGSWRGRRHHAGADIATTLGAIAGAFLAAEIPTSALGALFPAGVLSGLLGIGSGALKVLATDNAMRIPFKVSTSTSNFMSGVTAAASAGVYLNRGYSDPVLTMPVTLGVSAGSLLGARHLRGAGTGVLRIVFGVVVRVLGVEMIYSIFAFAAQRDRTYVVITLIVLAVLIGSLTGLASPPR